VSALWDEIDLSQHGVIEAHAGTGKTYTIVKLVLRMLETEDTDVAGRVSLTHIRQVLLVTFTEKAAGELNKRIREGLETRINELPENSVVRAHLENCLNNLHEAFIGTIHAVCLRLLQTWPFESGIPFVTEIVDDAEGLKATLRESMRTDWQDEATSIPWALAVLKKNGYRFGVHEFDLITQVARELLDAEFVRLDRSPVDDKSLPACKSATVTVAAELDATRDSYNECIGRLVEALNEARCSGVMASDRVVLVDKRIAELQQMQTGKGYLLKVMMNPRKVGAKGLYTNPDIKKIPGIARVDAAAAELSEHPFVNAYQKDKKLLDILPLALISSAAELLAQRWNSSKQKSGYLSYQDMLRLMHAAVAHRPRFAAALRAKLRFAIIDEFQDTSRLQWEVFSALFVTTATRETPRLFIVGDPKQSIYAFQGADVRSYIDARTTLCKNGDNLYRLTGNYRSLASTIRGYNAILASNDTEEDWFLFKNRNSGISYRLSEAVTAPHRENPPEHRLPIAPVQVLLLDGKKGNQAMLMAQKTGEAIEALIGSTISIPDGLGWKTITLEFEHFAVIVETHKLADSFLAAFRVMRIPAVKYKMEGVFQSAMARALHALLCALIAPSEDPAAKMAALLTVFFNRSPETLDAEKELTPCTANDCSGDSLCIAHALNEWSLMAEHRQWALLFRNIQERTGIAKRLIRLSDGERHLADLRQIIDYCIELLYSEKYTLVKLVEHLGSLVNKLSSAGRDQNLHVLETQKSSVKVLTMHAAKGLEFPVVFVVPGSSKKVRKGPACIRYTENDDGDNGKNHSVKVTPYLSIEDLRNTTGGTTPEDIYLLQTAQERRRLLYVALTRAQALLFVPMQCEGLQGSEKEPVRWSSATVYGDDDLTPRLQKVLDDPACKDIVSLFTEDTLLQVKKTIDPHNGCNKELAPPVAVPDIASLKLLSRICRQTSYSQLSRHVPGVREVDRSEEADAEGGTGAVPKTSLLPGGRTTGDALHCAIEEILGADNVTEVLTNKDICTAIITKYLKRNGIIGNMQGSDSEIIALARNCVVGALTTAIPLPGGLKLKDVASLVKSDRVEEMEFLLSVNKQWIHGYMDLVFRIKNPSGEPHPWRYFVLDWKSDSIGAYDDATLTHCITGRHYDLQARLYANALDTYLRGVLGSSYNPDEHLGGAVYLFLREHEAGPQVKASVWMYTASSASDRTFVNNLLSVRMHQ